MDSQWSHEANNFAAMDNNDYEKAFESYISDVDDDDEGKVTFHLHYSFFLFLYVKNNEICYFLGVMNQLSISYDSIDYLLNYSEN